MNQPTPEEYMYPPITPEDIENNNIPESELPFNEDGEA